MSFGVSILWSKSRMSEESCPHSAATATAPEARAAVMSAGLTPTKGMSEGGTPSSTAASSTDAGRPCRVRREGPVPVWAVRPDPRWRWWT